MKSIPTLHIEAENIPQAHHRAMNAVLRKGMQIRTQYDKKDSAGNYLDPASRDATVLISVRNPFNNPRYPIASCCEIGAYIAEIMGVKDHLVVPFDTLKRDLSSGKKLSATEWPYAYHQRLFAYPLADGTTVDQMGTLVERLAEGPISRRAVATTRVPEIDSFLKDDLPCLGEVQLRCTEDEGMLYLHMNTRWRSRDLFKAWADNVVGLTFMQQYLAKELERNLGREVKVGSYSDFSHSLHIYGQDIKNPGSMGMTAQQYVDISEDAIVGRAMDSEFASENLVIPQLQDLLTEDKIKEWRFGEKQIELLREIVGKIKSGEYLA
jgi:thymidylate synthase